MDSQPPSGAGGPPKAKKLENALGQIKNKQQIPEIDFTLHTTDDGTQVSTQERVIKDVQAPAFLKPTDEQFYSKTDPNKPDIAFLKNHFYREGRLTDDQALFILHRATEVLKNEPNLLEVDAPITGEYTELETPILSISNPLRSDLPAVCGDIHGQYVSNSKLSSTSFWIPASSFL